MEPVIRDLWSSHINWIVVYVWIFMRIKLFYQTATSIYKSKQTTATLSPCLKSYHKSGPNFKAAPPNIFNIGSDEYV